MKNKMNCSGDGREMELPPFIERNALILTGPSHAQRLIEPWTMDPGFDPVRVQEMQCDVL